MRFQDLELLVWCAAEIGLLLFFGFVTIRMMRRAATPVQRLRRLYGGLAGYMLLTTVLGIWLFGNSGYTNAGAVLYGCMSGAFHLVLVSPLIFIGLRMIH
jgi:hypothetical protein